MRGWGTRDWGDTASRRPLPVSMAGGLKCLWTLFKPRAALHHPHLRGLWSDLEADVGCPAGARPFHPVKVAAGKWARVGQRPPRWPCLPAMGPAQHDPQAMGLLLWGEGSWATPASPQQHFCVARRKTSPLPPDLPAGPPWPGPPGAPSPSGAKGSPGATEETGPPGRTEAPAKGRLPVPPPAQQRRLSMASAPRGLPPPVSSGSILTAARGREVRI